MVPDGGFRLGGIPFHCLQGAGLAYLSHGQFPAERLCGITAMQRMGLDWEQGQGQQLLPAGICWARDGHKGIKLPDRDRGRDRGRDRERSPCSQLSGAAASPRTPLSRAGLSADVSFLLLALSCSASCHHHERLCCLRSQQDVSHIAVAARRSAVSASATCAGSEQGTGATLPQLGTHIQSSASFGRPKPTGTQGTCKPLQLSQWRMRRMEKAHTPPTMAFWLRSPCPQPPAGAARAHLPSAHACGSPGSAGAGQQRIGKGKSFVLQGSKARGR